MDLSIILENPEKNFQEFKKLETWELSLIYSIILKVLTEKRKDYNIEKASRIRSIVFEQICERENKFKNYSKLGSIIDEDEVEIDPFDDMKTEKIAFMFSKLLYKIQYEKNLKYKKFLDFFHANFANCLCMDKQCDNCANKKNPIPSTTEDTKTPKFPAKDFPAFLLSNNQNTLFPPPFPSELSKNLSKNLSNFIPPPFVTSTKLISPPFIDIEKDISLTMNKKGVVYIATSNGIYDSAIDKKNIKKNKKVSDINCDFIRAYTDGFIVAKNNTINVLDKKFQNIFEYKIDENILDITCRKEELPKESKVFFALTKTKIYKFKILETKSAKISAKNTSKFLATTIMKNKKEENILLLFKDNGSVVDASTDNILFRLFDKPVKTNVLSVSCIGNKINCLVESGMTYNIDFDLEWPECERSSETKLNDNSFGEAVLTTEGIFVIDKTLNEILILSECMKKIVKSKKGPAWFDD